MCSRLIEARKKDMAAEIENAKVQMAMIQSRNPQPTLTVGGGSISALSPSRPSSMIRSQPNNLLYAKPPSSTEEVANNGTRGPKLLPRISNKPSAPDAFEQRIDMLEKRHQERLAAIYSGRGDPEESSVHQSQAPVAPMAPHAYAPAERSAIATPIPQPRNVQHNGFEPPFGYGTMPRYPPVASASQFASTGGFNNVNAPAATNTVANNFNVHQLNVFGHAYGNGVQAYPQAPQSFFPAGVNN